MSAEDEAACRAFLDDLPDTLADQERRDDVKPDDALGAAYGDPAIIVRCGVGTPPGFTLESSCEEVNGVGWYVPPEQYDDQGADATLYTAGYSPVVEVEVPAEYRPEGPASVFGQLTPLVPDHLDFATRCKAPE